MQKKYWDCEIYGCKIVQIFLMSILIRTIQGFLKVQMQRRKQMQHKDCQKIGRYNVFRVIMLVRHAEDDKLYLYDIIKKETSNLFQS